MINASDCRTIEALSHYLVSNLIVEATNTVVTLNGGNYRSLIMVVGNIDGLNEIWNMDQLEVLVVDYGQINVVADRDDRGNSVWALILSENFIKFLFPEFFSTCARLSVG